MANVYVGGMLADWEEDSRRKIVFIQKQSDRLPPKSRPSGFQIKRMACNLAFAVWRAGDPHRAPLHQLFKEAVQFSKL